MSTKAHGEMSVEGYCPAMALRMACCTNSNTVMDRTPTSASAPRVSNLVCP